MKPFDLEKAKAGHPVVTRSGLEVRILCFDIKGMGKYPIAAAVTEGPREILHGYTVDGNFIELRTSPWDLFMASQKKEKWVVVSNQEIIHGPLDSDEEAREFCYRWNIKPKAICKIDWEE